MARTWRDIRSKAVQDGHIDESAVAMKRQEAVLATEAYTLAELRQAARLSQAEVAHQLGVSQPHVSRFERADLSRASLVTIQAYVRAIGGTLRVTVDQTHRLAVLLDDAPTSQSTNRPPFLDHRPYASPAWFLNPSVGQLPDDANARHGLGYAH